ncbi:hypothetical protein AcV5_002270 [Taiwanofungus camphoratus]|nr:hypothetical protein AcV5_002270 [Antrodia cinnamomea]
MYNKSMVRHDQPLMCANVLAPGKLVSGDPQKRALDVVIIGSTAIEDKQKDAYILELIKGSISKEMATLVFHIHDHEQVDWGSLGKCIVETALPLNIPVNLIDRQNMRYMPNFVTMWGQNYSSYGSWRADVPNK